MSDSLLKLGRRRQLPKLMACLTKNSLENLRNKALYSIDALDAKDIRRRKKPLWQCLILEMKESGYTEAADYLQDLLYDNAQLVAEDDIGIVVDLRTREDYLEHICSHLQKAEKEKERDNSRKEAQLLLNLGLHYAEKGKGILWLAEKFFLVAMAVASRFMLDGGRLKNICKYYYAKFLLDKFPGADSEEAFVMLTEVRDAATGTTWPLYEPDVSEVVASDTVFGATAIQLHRVLLGKCRAIRKTDTAKAERLARLAERRGQDANDAPRTAEAIVEVGICQLLMDNLNNAKKTFERAFNINTQINNIIGLCVTRMHLAAVMQKLGDHETAARLLTEMGALAMEHSLRRQLGRALHLLGELHLRRERPDLGTHHLIEAFYCFQGYVYHIALPEITLIAPDSDQPPVLGVVYDHSVQEVYADEAEQSRLMMAISAGQEHMPAFFELIREAKTCTVAKIKCIEWKVSKAGWWIKRLHHDMMPCLCPVHNRTPLDVLRHQLKLMNEKSDMDHTILYVGDSIQDLQRLRSSRISRSEFEISADMIVATENKVAQNIDCTAVSSMDNKTVSKAESKTVGKIESKTVGRAESRTVSKAESRTVSKAESRTVSKAESRTAGKAESKTVNKAESKTVNRVDSKAHKVDSKTVHKPDSNVSQHRK